MVGEVKMLNCFGGLSIGSRQFPFCVGSDIGVREESMESTADGVIVWIFPYR